MSRWRQRCRVCPGCYVDSNNYGLSLGTVLTVVEREDCHECEAATFFDLSVRSDPDAQCEECVEAYHEKHPDDYQEDCPCDNCISARDNKCPICDAWEGADCCCCEECENIEGECTCYCSECSELTDDCECEAQLEEPPTWVDPVSGAVVTLIPEPGHLPRHPSTEYKIGSSGKQIVISEGVGEITPHTIPFVGCECTPCWDHRRDRRMEIPSLDSPAVRQAINEGIEKLKDSLTREVFYKQEYPKPEPDIVLPEGARWVK